MCDIQFDRPQIAVARAATIQIFIESPRLTLSRDGIGPDYLPCGTALRARVEARHLLVKYWISAIFYAKNQNSARNRVPFMDNGGKAADLARAPLEHVNLDMAGKARFEHQGQIKGFSGASA